MSGFFSINVVILVVYTLASVWIGLRHAHKQRSLDDYFLAERSAPWWAAGISVIASDTSAIPYVDAPTYVFKKERSFR